MGFADNAEFSYVALVRKASAKGMEIKALDASTCYDLDDALNLGDTPPTTTRSTALRNFYSHKVLQGDSEALPDERWIALLDPARMRAADQVQGLADLHKAVSVRVEDAALTMPWVCASTPATLPPITPWPCAGLNKP